MCQRCPSSEKNTRVGIHLAQAVVGTTRYGPSLPNEWRKRQETSPPRPSSGENARLRLRLGQALGKRQSTGPPWSRSGVIDRVRLRLGEAVA
ncbi:hypothetical protein Y032_0179g739 [Ancylostoma ceylanicum]|uniref:Uncharacterized protein n=1 Tax=Ancylostoma ceylanicum TaxID=53326 RepID=A0A016SSS1_9BILA|nr:hypothetical protein Y032_0179g739 [Ancylostoma ceylanicum]